MNNKEQLQPPKGKPQKHSPAHPIPTSSIPHSSLLTPRHCEPPKALPRHCEPPKALPRHCEPPKAVWQSTNAKRTWKFGCWLFLYPKSAFTLIELLVYIAILGFIIVVAGRAYSDSTIMRVRSQNMLKSAEALGRASTLLKEDISQMGIGAWGKSSASNSYVVTAASGDIYMSPTTGDSSSYALTRDAGGESLDSIAFRRAAFDTLGTFLGVREISWSARSAASGGAELYRRCRTVIPATPAPASDPELDACPADPTDLSGAPAVLVTKNVSKFILTPSAPGIAPPDPIGATSDTLFPTAVDLLSPSFKLLSREAGGDVVGINPSASSTTTVDITGLAKNSSPQDGGIPSSKKFAQAYLGANDAGAWTDCAKLQLKKGETYSVEFNMPFPQSGESDSLSSQLQPGIDHLAVGLRDPNNPDDVIAGAPSDVLFYPPQSTDAKTIRRHAEFSPSEDINDCCVALTFAFYSPKASKGKYSFSDFKVLRKADEAFHFPRVADGYNALYGTEDDPADKLIHKRNAKAFELVLEINNKGEVASTRSQNESGLTIPTPNNGAKPQ